MEGAAEPRVLRALVIGRKRHVRMRSDLVLELMTSQPGFRRLVLGAVVFGVVAAASGGWPWAFAAVGWVFFAALYWWTKAGRALRSGLSVGQRVSVGHGPNGELQVIDETGSLGVARGAAFAVIRWRANVSVYTGSVSFVLPGELLSDEDTAFLLDASTPAPSLAGSSEVLMDTETQRRMVGTATRVVMTSADFLFPAVTALAAFAAVTVLGSPTVIAVAAVACLGWALAGLEGIFTSRRAVGMTYLPGRRWQLAAGTDGFTVTSGGVTRTCRWADYRAHRITAPVVMLRPRRRPLSRTVTELFPAALFDGDAQREMTARIPRRF